MYNHSAYVYLSRVVNFVSSKEVNMMDDEHLKKLGHLVGGLPLELKNEIASDLAQKMLETLAGFPADVVVAISVNMLANAVAAGAVSEDKIDTLIDRTVEQIRPIARDLYPTYKHMRNQNGS